MSCFISWVSFIFSRGDVLNELKSKKKRRHFFPGATIVSSDTAVYMYTQNCTFPKNPTILNVMRTENTVKYDWSHSPNKQQNLQMTSWICEKKYDVKASILPICDFLHSPHFLTKIISGGKHKSHILFTLLYDREHTQLLCPLSAIWLILISS